jgi:hypothetical protein
VNPLRRVANLRVDVLERDGEVNQVQIKIFKAKIVEGALNCMVNVFGLVESVPEFRDDKEIFALNESFGNGAVNSISNFFLVSIIASTVKKTVTSLDGCKDGVSANIFGDFPEAETSLGHLSSSVEDEVFSV